MHAKNFKQNRPGQGLMLKFEVTIKHLILVCFSSTLSTSPLSKTTKS